VAGKKKSSSKKTDATEKDLRAKAEKLRSKLDRAEAKAQRWKGVARRHEKAANESRATVKKLRKRLDKASSEGSVPEAAAPAAVSSAAGPDETWTVVRLRAEARSRGLTGLSGKSKAELLEALS
jgi:hypothetical protein